MAKNQNTFAKRQREMEKKRKAEEKVLELVSQVRDLEITPTETALEAALLEAEEIKRLVPGQTVFLYAAIQNPKGAFLQENQK